MRTQQPASKKKAKRRQASASATITEPQPEPAPAQSWWEWGTSALSGIASSVTSVWSTPDPATSRIQPSATRTAPEAAETDAAPPSRIQPSTARTAPEAPATDGDAPNRIQPKEAPSAAATATGGKSKKSRRRRKARASTATVDTDSADATEAPPRDADSTADEPVSVPPVQPETEPVAAVPEPQIPAIANAAAPEAAASKRETKGEKAARLRGEKQKVIDAAIASAKNVIVERRKRLLSSQPLQEVLNDLTREYKNGKGKDWRKIEDRFSQLQQFPDAAPEKIAADEDDAKTNYDRFERPDVDDAPRVLQLAITHKIDARKTAESRRLLAEIGEVLRDDPPGYARARKLGRDLRKALAEAAKDVELAVKCTAEIDDLRRLVGSAEVAAADALAPTAPALPPGSRTKYWADTTAKWKRALETAMAADPRNWSEISKYMSEARRAAEGVQHEIAIAPKRANDMVGGNHVPLETQKVGELHGDGVDGEVEAVREALRSIHGVRPAPGEQQWTGGGGKWDADHGNYHPQYGESYGVHSGPLPPLPNGERYREYYVRQAPGRGDLRRIVRSRVDKRIWYTWDHYKTFVLLDET